MKTRSEKLKKKNTGKKIFITVIAIMILFISGILGYGYSKLNKINTVDFENSDTELGITKEKASGENKVANILLLGADKQEKATDTMIVLSLDKTSKKIKLTSMMRDTFVYFGKNMGNKLNYAYHYGGAKLTVKTINEKFKLDMRDYILVDFEGLISIIDYLGGVEIDVLPEEVKWINDKGSHYNEQPVPGYKPVTRPGLQTLDGKQALGYCRVRQVGNVDYQRTERQRIVLTKLLEKAKNTSVFDVPGLIDTLSQYVETSLTKTEMLSLFKDLLLYNKNGIAENRVPYDGYKSDYTDVNGWYYMKWDEQKNVELLHKFIYQDK